MAQLSTLDINRHNNFLRLPSPRLARDGGRYYEELLQQNPGMLMARSNWSTASKGQESFLKPNCQIAYFQIISLVL